MHMRTTNPSDGERNGELRSEQLSGFGEGSITVAGNNQMIENRNPEEITCLAKTERDFQVIVRRLKAVSWMIVNQNAGCSMVQKTGNESLARVD